MDKKTKYIEMREEAAVRDFLNLYKAFKNFTEDENNFNCNDCEQIHQNMINLMNQRLDDYQEEQKEKEAKPEIAKILEIVELILDNGHIDEKSTEEEVVLADYYFVDDRKLYALDVSNKCEEFGFYDDKNADNENVVYCNLMEFREYYEMADIKFNIVFSYNKKTKKLANILDISRFSYNTINPKVVRSLNDEKNINKVYRLVKKEINKR